MHQEIAATPTRRFVGVCGRWDKWTPQDPATLSEAKEREEEEEQKKSRYFEENNAEFCSKMIDDMKIRSEARYETSANRSSMSRMFMLKQPTSPAGASTVVQQLLSSRFLARTGEFVLSRFSLYVPRPNTVHSIALFPPKSWPSNRKIALTPSPDYDVDMT